MAIVFIFGAVIFFIAGLLYIKDRNDISAIICFTLMFIYFSVYFLGGSK